MGYTKYRMSENYIMAVLLYAAKETRFCCLLLSPTKQVPSEHDARESFE